MTWRQSRQLQALRNAFRGQRQKAELLRHRRGGRTLVPGTGVSILAPVVPRRESAPAVERPQPLRVGESAQVSATGGGRWRPALSLDTQEVRTILFQDSGIALEWEIARVGEPAQTA